MTDADTARRVLALLDLTDLTENCSDHVIDALCAKAATPHGSVAAICIWPQLVSRARAHLSGRIRIATVANFPAGGEDVERVIEDVGQALTDGADEIDLVLPYRAFMRGEEAIARDMIAGVRDVTDRGRTLKVILETGMIGDSGTVRAASRLALDLGADFIKTSTGKTPVSATPEAVRIMLEEIAATPRPAGIKPSGGIRTLADAKIYLALADEMMGEAWATPATFRFGASGLFNVLMATLDGSEPPPSPAAY
jgi:deoxyribose-phosphate aldolase